MRLIKGKDGEKLLTIYFKKTNFCFLVLSKTQVYLLIYVYCSPSDVALLWHQQKSFRFSLYQETASLPALLKEFGSRAWIQTAQAFLDTGWTGWAVLFTGSTSLQSGLDLQHRNVLEQPNWCGCHTPVCLMELGNKMVPANLKTAHGAVGAICGLWGMGNSSELSKELSALPTKSITGSSGFTAGAAELIPAPAHPTWIITCWSTG